MTVLMEMMVPLVLMVPAGDAGLGPYASSSVWLDAGPGYGCCSAYLIGLLFTLIVFSLYRAQKDLDDPFSSTEPDAIRWDAWRCELEALGESSLSLSFACLCVHVVWV